MATKSIAWETGSGNITLTYTGQGDDTISVVSDPNDVGSARSQTITIQTTRGGLVTKNVTVSQAACPIPVGTVLNYAYTGSYQEVTLPAGQYKLQCWGAQGGSNAAASSYGITAKAGGKGGYSEGVLTLTSKTTVRVYVGGAGSSSAGGFNGGGSTSGSSTYNSGGTYGTSRMGGGGGATDIRLSDSALLSRMIVAGGGSGGAMCYKAVTTTVTTWTDVFSDNAASWTRVYQSGNNRTIYVLPNCTDSALVNYNGLTAKFVGVSGSTPDSIIVEYYMGTRWIAQDVVTYNQEFELRAARNHDRININFLFSGNVTISDCSFKIQQKGSSTSTDTETNSQVGYVGGGTTGGGYSSTYQGKQNAAGTGGSFGQGADITSTNTRYCSGAGGGGWYGGGVNAGDSDISRLNMSGGGSGWVNTYANRSYRPSGYNGLQLDSGSTTAGSSSFPAPGGGNETGHAGNGYARITRLS